MRLVLLARHIKIVPARHWTLDCTSRDQKEAHTFVINREHLLEKSYTRSNNSVKGQNPN